MRLLNVGAVLTAVLSLGAIIGTAACEPAPPPPPAPLPGTPHFDGSQALTVGLILPSGETVICQLTLTTAWDLSYRSATVTSKATVTEGADHCRSTDWINRLALGSCNAGSSIGSCGSAWAIPSSGLAEQRTFYFEPLSPPQPLSQIKVNFQAVLKFPSALTFPVSVSGDTPPIRCSAELLVCRFQV
jgi:hypothetical protein